MEGVARRHQALSDPVRLRLLWALSMADLCPCILKQIAELSDSKLSYHLGVLERAVLVSSKRTKDWMIYSITPWDRRSWMDDDWMGPPWCPSACARQGKGYSGPGATTLLAGDSP